jgi:predicted MFS family arabinose efflux permease
MGFMGGPLIEPMAPLVRRSVFERVISRREQVTLYAAMCSVYFFAVFQRVAIPGAIFDELQMGFKATAAQITTLSAVSLYVYGLMQLPVGIIADRWGGARPLLVGGVLMGIGYFILPLAPSLWVLYLGSIFISFGGSFIFLCLVKEADDLFGHQHFTMMVGIMLGVGYVGGLGATIPLTAGVSAFGWRASFLFAAVLCAAGVMGSVMLLRSAKRAQPRVMPISWSAVGVLVRHRAILPLVAAGALNFMGYLLMQATLGKKYFQDCWGFTPGEAARVTFAMPVIIMFGCFFGGLLPKLIGGRKRPLMLFSAGCSVVGAGMLYTGVAWGMPVWWSIAGCLLLTANPALASIGATLLKEIAPRGTTALMAGISNGFGYVAVAMNSTFAGLALNAYNAEAVVTATAVIYPRGAYETIFLAMVGATGVALVIVWWVTPEGEGGAGGK